MQTRVAMALAFLLAIAADLSARDPIKVKLPADTMQLELKEGQLLVSREGGRAVGVAGTDEREKVTSFAVSDWNGSEGLAVALEFGELGNSRSYGWMTLRVDTTNGSSQPGANKQGFGIVAKDRIFNNIEPLSILDVSNPIGDSLVITLYDQANIPDTDRKLAIRYQHDCPIAAIPGNFRRFYTTPKFIKMKKEEAGSRVWQQ
jgi:hypothetical protein